MLKQTNFKIFCKNLLVRQKTEISENLVTHLIEGGFVIATANYNDYYECVMNICEFFNLLRFRFNMLIKKYYVEGCRAHITKLFRRALPAK